MKQLYSYDIFDTCLVRTCGEAKNVFYLLATKVLGPQANISAKNDFALIRMNAEKKAREELIYGCYNYSCFHIVIILVIIRDLCFVGQ